MEINVLEATRTLQTPGVFIEKTGNFQPSFQKDGTIVCDEIIECYTFTSKKSYEAKNCLDYSIRDRQVVWGDGDISEAKKPHWIIGTIICLVIPCDDGTKYLSYQKITDANGLTPLRIYNIQKDNKPFMVLGKNKKLYFSNFIEN